MKTSINLLLLILFLSFNSCSKNDNCDNPVECLPPATQTGARTFGCLINNKPFSPRGSQLGGPTLQIDYRIYEGKYRFSISGDNNKTGEAVLIKLQDQNNLLEDKVYVLQEYRKDINYGRYLISGTDYQTNSDNAGEMIFSKIDLDAGIISGTFWFDANNGEGEVIEIREGRFDMNL